MGLGVRVAVVHSKVGHHGIKNPVIDGRGGLVIKILWLRGEAIESPFSDEISGSDIEEVPSDHN